MLFFGKLLLLPAALKHWGRKGGKGLGGRNNLFTQFPSSGNTLQLLKHPQRCIHLAGAAAATYTCCRLLTPSLEGRQHSTPAAQSGVPYPKIKIKQHQNKNWGTSDCT